MSCSNLLPICCQIVDRLLTGFTKYFDHLAATPFASTGPKTRKIKIFRELITIDIGVLIT